MFIYTERELLNSEIYLMLIKTKRGNDNNNKAQTSKNRAIIGVDDIRKSSCLKLCVTSKYICLSQSLMMVYF